MSASRVYRTEALVLREIDYGEADRILTLLTPAGKVSAIAHGVRRATSRKSGHLGLLARSQLMMARGRNLDVVTQAEAVERYEGLRGDLLRFTYGCYVGELMVRFAQEEEPSADLYELAIRALHWFSEREDLTLWARYFEICLLRVAGYRPEMYHCVRCRQPVKAVANAFSAAQGGVLCSDCRPEGPDALEISLGGQKVFRYLLSHDEGDVARLRIRPETGLELEGLLQHYLEYVLERRVSSVEFLQRLRRELAALRARRRRVREDRGEGVQSDG